MLFACYFKRKKNLNEVTEIGSALCTQRSILLPSYLLLKILLYPVFL